MFDKEEFRDYLQDRKIPANTMAQFIRLANEFFDYLQKYRQTSLENQQAEDLHEFFTWLDQQFRRPRINRYFYALKAYYGFKADKDLYHTTNEILGIISLEALKLKEFAGVDPTVAKTLAAKEIRTAAQLLAITRTQVERDKLAKDTNISEALIIELVKLSNLARIPGLKQKRARLFYDAGLDTLDKIAAYDDPEDLVTLFAQFVERTNFVGRAVTPAEAQFTLSMAKYLKPITTF